LLSLSPPEARSARPGALEAILLLGVALAVFAIAYDNGAFNVSARSALGLVVWWGLIVAVGLRLMPLEPLPRAVVLVGCLLGAFAALTLLSAAWGPSFERAFLEFTRASLFLGVFLVAALGSSRRNLRAWTDGLAVALSATAAVALASRLFPDLFSTRGVVEFLPSWLIRLSFPVGYWNGLAILLALAVPLLLEIAGSERRAVIRGAGVAPLPLVAAAIYLASSRGGFATAAVGAAAYVLATDRRWPAVGALALGLVGSVAAVATLAARDELANGPLGASVVAEQGRSAAVLIGLVAVAVALGYGGLVALQSPVPSPSARVGRIAVAAGMVALVGVLLASHPVDRFNQFRQPPVVLAAPTPNFVASHLSSVNGNGRWQFWGAALDEWDTRPLLGRGAGTYEAWWAQHGSIPFFTRDAHSLYLETLGELGLVGFAVLAALVGTALLVGVGRVRGASAVGRPPAAALLALVAAFLVGVGIDWMWELTVVPIVGMVALGLLVGPATAAAPGSVRRVPFGLGVAFIGLAWVVVCAQGMLLLTQAELDRSERAVTADDGPAALRHAQSAQALLPWAASPRLQLALVYERMGRLRDAREAIGEAIHRDPDNWRNWYTQTRIEAKAGDVRASRRSLRRAVELNPRSSLFGGQRPATRVQQG
jgi:hypothetical protein